MHRHTPPFPFDQFTARLRSSWQGLEPVERGHPAQAGISRTHIESPRSSGVARSAGVCCIDQLRGAESKIENRESRIRRRALRGGFTMLEILLVIGLLALLCTVLITGVVQWVDAPPVAPEEVFWKSVQEARKSALRTEHEVRLRFDQEKKRFVLFDGLAPTITRPDGTVAETPLKEFPIPNAPADLEMDFLAPMKGGNAILVRGVLVETQSVPYVKFYADGTCSPFRLQIFRPGGASTLAIDPWTCAPMLEKKDVR